VDIQYLWIFDNDTWLGGYVTQSSFPPAWGIVVGSSFIIRVQDNGEGNKAVSPDKISLPNFMIDPANVTDPHLVPDLAS